MIATENAAWRVLRVKEEVQDLKQILQNLRLQPALQQCNTGQHWTTKQAGRFFFLIICFFLKAFLT